MMMKREGVLLLLLTACTGNVSGGRGAPGTGGEPSSSAPGGSSNPAPGGAATPPPVTSTCDPGTLPAARVWRLTGAQFRNTALAVFGVSGPAADTLPADGSPDGFSNQADRLSVPPVLASKYMQAADEIATAVATRAGDFIKCSLSDLGAGTCLKDFLTSVGLRAWRRPLTPAEISKYTALYGTLAQANSPDVGFKGVVQALVLSPNFLFRTELGAGGAGTIAMDDFELASALSYMLVDGPPDAALMDLAVSGRLHDPATRAAQAKRLLGSAPVAAKTMTAFFRQWLQFDTLADATKDATLFPSYTPEVAADLLTENDAFLNGVLFDPAGDHSVETLLTARFGYVTSRTAPLYGVQASAATPTRTDLPAAQRRGLLTDAAFIAGISDVDDTNLPARGRIVREQALCATVAPPPGNFTLDDPKITPDMTNREKFITHTTNPSCAACHSMFDGIGFALEQYDPIGRFRTMDKTKTIDPTGTLPLGSTTLTFSSYVDFIDQIAKRPETYACVATQYAAFATGRAPSAISACESDGLAKAFADGNHKLDALVAAVVTSPSFILRRN